MVSNAKQLKRLEILDILRGFALLGICIANAGYFSLYVFQSPGQKAAFAFPAADKLLESFTLALVEGKFYSLFSLLFGVGFAIIFFQKNAGGKQGLIFFYRRLLFLLLFGLIHSFLIWDGDILFFYGVTGLLLPLFRNLSNRTLIITAVILLLSPLLFDLVKVMTNGSWNISHPFTRIAKMLDRKAGIEEKDLSHWLVSHHRYADELKWNSSGFFWSWQLRLDSNRLPKVLAMFILGMCLGRSRFHENLYSHKVLLKKIARVGFILGICAGIGLVYFEHDEKSLPAAEGLLDTLFYALNVVPLSLAYASGLALLYMRNRLLVSWLQPVGQMALTNYIMQSVICIVIYHGIGFGAGSHAGPVHFIPAAVIVFLVQAAYSYWWMQYFNYGPLEWLWRQLTYGKRIKLRKTDVEDNPATG